MNVAGARVSENPGKYRSPHPLTPAPRRGKLFNDGFFAVFAAKKPSLNLSG
jgi:hypothetical protein